jgi:hypothetical protein
VYLLILGGSEDHYFVIELGDLFCFGDVTLKTNGIYSSCLGKDCPKHHHIVLKAVYKISIKFAPSK